MSTLVMKFGGASVGNTTALAQVLSIVLHERTRRDRLMLVVSALDGVTDALLEATRLAHLGNRRGYRRITATLRTRHLALIEKLPLGNPERTALQADIDRLLFDMLNTCQAISDNTTGEVRPEAVDAVIGVGEKLAARIVAALLRQHDILSVAIDTTDLIVTDETHRHAEPNMAVTRARIQTGLLPMLERKIVPVVTGFIAITPSGKPTTLGRGGSDYTASILSVCSDAEEAWIWTDVDGIMSVDPHAYEIAETQVIPELAYEEMAELAYFGARVLHSRMVAPLRDAGIPLRVKNIYKPQQPGTLIHGGISSRNTPAIHAVTAIQGIGLTSPASKPLSAITGLMDETMYAMIGLRADVMLSAQASAGSFLCFVIPTSAGQEALHTVLNTLEERISATPALSEWTVEPVTLVSVIGSGLNGTPSLTGRVLLALDSIQLLAIAQSPARCSITVVVSPVDADTAVRRLHPLTLPPAPLTPSRASKS